MHRSLTGPLVLSAALHAGLFLALLGFRGNAPPNVHPHVITVELVALADIVDADGERDGGAPLQRASETGPNTDQPLEELTAAEPAAAPAADEPTEVEPTVEPQTDTQAAEADTGAASLEGTEHAARDRGETPIDEAERMARQHAEGRPEELTEPSLEPLPVEGSEPRAAPASPDSQSAEPERLAAAPEDLGASEHFASASEGAIDEAPAAAVAGEPLTDEADVLIGAEPSPAAAASVSEARPAPLDGPLTPDEADPALPGMRASPPGTDLEHPHAALALPALAEAAQPRAASTPMQEAQQRMLEDRLSAWAERFADRPPEPVTEWEHDGQTYTASFTRLPASDDMGLEEVMVEISTEADGRQLSAEMRMRRMAFSHFAQFIDRWDPSVQIHDDEIEGRFHSNSDIHVSQSWTAQPTFHGRVTTSRSVNTASSPRRVSRADVFRGGLETRVRRIGLPRRASVALPDGVESRDDALHLEEDAHVVFHGDGTLAWRYAGGAEQRLRLPDAPFYVVAADRATVHVRGTVRGKVLVYSPERIVVEGDLVYAADPELDADAADYVGLVSEKNVEIAEPAITGPGDLTIHASIYAKRRFSVRRYTARGEADARLDIYGSVSAGSLSATEPRFRTRIRFDPRFERARPPGFPVTDRYEMAAWDGEWTVAEEEGDQERTLMADDRAPVEPEQRRTVH